MRFHAVPWAPLITSVGGRHASAFANSDDLCCTLPATTSLSSRQRATRQVSGFVRGQETLRLSAHRPDSVYTCSIRSHSIYEIAPDDYTFEIHLIYYDFQNPTTPIDVRIDDGEYVLGRQKFSTNRKVINLVPREVEDFQIAFQKGSQLNGAAANDDWAIVGNITLSATPAP